MSERWQGTALQAQRVGAAAVWLLPRRDRRGFIGHSHNPGAAVGHGQPHPGTAGHGNRSLRGRADWQACQFGAGKLQIDRWAVCTLGCRNL